MGSAAGLPCKGARGFEGKGGRSFSQAGSGKAGGHMCLLHGGGGQQRAGFHGGLHRIQRAHLGGFHQRLGAGHRGLRRFVVAGFFPRTHQQLVDLFEQCIADFILKFHPRCRFLAERFLHSSQRREHFK
eukprot:EG_transcript_29094